MSDMKTAKPFGNFRAVKKGRFVQHPCFVSGETEGQRGNVTCSKSLV
jgi:hypothetical protein